MIYLASTSVAPDRVLAEGLADDAIALVDGLIAVDSDLGRSKLYHGLKRLQASADPLLVAELSEPPKFKGMASGSLSWFRERVDR